MGKVPGQLHLIGATLQWSQKLAVIPKAIPAFAPVMCSSCCGRPARVLRLGGFQDVGVTFPQSMLG